MVALDNKNKTAASRLWTRKSEAKIPPKKC